jgi:hypothetical protein
MMSGKEVVMFIINDDKSIYLTRGDIPSIDVCANISETEPYVFKTDDVVRLKIVEKKNYDNVVLEKDVMVEEETLFISIVLTRTDTKIGGIINKPVDYWYEIELNPDTAPQTFIGHDDDGPKIFRLFPEGDDVDA